MVVAISPCLFATQFPVNQWHQKIEDPTLADAILDRIVHDSVRLTLKGGGWPRFAQFSPIGVQSLTWQVLQRLKFRNMPDQEVTLRNLKRKNRPWSLILEQSIVQTSRKSSESTENFLSNRYFAYPKR